MSNPTAMLSGVVRSIVPERANTASGPSKREAVASISSSIISVITKAGAQFSQVAGPILLFAMLPSATAANDDALIIAPTDDSGNLGFLAPFNQPSIPQWSLLWFEERLSGQLKDIQKRHDLARLLEAIFGSIQNCSMAAHNCCANFWHAFDAVAENWQRIAIEDNPGVVSPPCSDTISHLTRRALYHRSTLPPHSPGRPGDGSAADVTASSSGWSIGTVDILVYMFEFAILVFVVYQLWRIFGTHKERIGGIVGHGLSKLGDGISYVRERADICIGRFRHHNRSSSDDSEMSMSGLLDAEQGQGGEVNDLSPQEDDE